jgi:hypothetical protein
VVREIQEGAGKCRETQGGVCFYQGERWGQMGQKGGQILAEERIRVSDDTLDHDWKGTSHHDPRQACDAWDSMESQVVRHSAATYLHCESSLVVHVRWHVCLSGAGKHGLSFGRSERGSTVSCSQSVEVTGRVSLQNYLRQGSLIIILAGGRGEEDGE